MIASPRQELPRLPGHGRRAAWGGLNLSPRVVSSMSRSAVGKPAVLERGSGAVGQRPGVFSWGQKKEPRFAGVQLRFARIDRRREIALGSLTFRNGLFSGVLEGGENGSLPRRQPGLNALHGRTVERRRRRSIPEAVGPEKRKQTRKPPPRLAERWDDASRGGGLPRDSHTPRRPPIPWSAAYNWRPPTFKQTHGRQQTRTRPRPGATGPVVRDADAERPVRLIFDFPCQSRKCWTQAVQGFGAVVGSFRITESKSRKNRSDTFLLGIWPGTTIRPGGGRPGPLLNENTKARLYFMHRMKDRGFEKNMAVSFHPLPIELNRYCFLMRARAM